MKDIFGYFVLKFRFIINIYMDKIRKTSKPKSIQ